MEQKICQSCGMPMVTAEEFGINSDGSPKAEILERICYTELVYERINKKLDSKFSQSEIEKMIFDIVKETQEMFFKRIGKNIYVTNFERNIKITVNSNTGRIITVDKLNQTKKLYLYRKLHGHYDAITK